MRARKREETHREQPEVGFWMQHWPRRREGPRWWPWQTVKVPESPSQGTADSRLVTTDSVSGGLGSGSFGPNDVVLKVPSGDSMQVPHEKPWYSLHGFLTYVARQRDKIPRRFRRTRAGVGDDGAHRRLEPTTAPPPSFREAIGDDKSVTNGQDIAASRPLDSNTLGTAETISPNQLPSRVSKAPPLGSHVKRPASHVKRPASNGESRRGIAFMDGSTLRERSEEHPLIVAENDQGLASETAGGKRKAQSEFQTQRVSGLGMAHEEPRPPEYSSSASWETDETSHGSQPSPATKDCVDSAEFASSAIMVQCPTGRHESVKLFYDTGCADNLASRKFIDKYGFKERPLLKDDLKVYETPAGVSFIPSRYVEIELRDTEHGIEDFTKTSFNVADAMDEIGLLAGRKFMIKHGVSLSAKEGPGAYVLISKKLSEDDKRRQKLLLDQTSTAMERAKAYTASGSGSTTMPTATSQAQHPAASSHTSTSSGAKNSTPGK